MMDRTELCTLIDLCVHDETQRREARSRIICDGHYIADLEAVAAAADSAEIVGRRRGLVVGALAGIVVGAVGTWVAGLIS